ncbi:MAG: biotin carboxyl carrier protein [Myxococcota bacterium]
MCFTTLGCGYPETMLPDRQGLVRVRANIDGEVEVRARIGETIVPRQLMAVVEGDEQIESLSVRKTSIVESILVKNGTEVTAGTALMVVREVGED